MATATSVQNPALMGVGTTSLNNFAMGYRHWWRRRNERSKNPLPVPSMLYLPIARTELKPAAIYLVETTALLIQMRHLLPAASTVIVSDSPLLLNEFAALKPLDWTKDCWRFRIHPINWPEFEAARKAALRNTDKSIWQEVVPVSVDRLGLVIEQTSGGLLMQPINAVLSPLNFAIRVNFRRLLGQYITNKIGIQTFQNSATDVICQGQHPSEKPLNLMSLTKVVDVLKVNGDMYRRAVVDYSKKKKMDSIVKDTKMTAFEVRYLSKLVEQPDETMG